VIALVGPLRQGPSSEERYGSIPSKFRSKKPRHLGRDGNYRGMRSQLVTLLILSLFTVACLDDESNDVDETAADDDTDSHLVPLVEVELSPGHLLSFYVDETASPAVVTATEVTPPDATSVLGHAKQAGATSLELFLAAAGTTEVPSELEASHVVETSRLGRPNADVLELAAPPSLDVDPPCTSQSTFDDWFAVASAAPSDWTDSFYSAAGPASFELYESSTSYQNAYFGGCNNDGGAKNFSYCWKVPGGSFHCTSTYGVAVGSTYYATKFTTSWHYFKVVVTYPSMISGTSRLGLGLD
jgi:hypothetical protein